MRHPLTVLVGVLPAVAVASEPTSRPYSQTAANPMTVIDADSHKQYINSVCVTPAGTWLISVTTTENRETFTYTRRSADRGRSWEPRVVAYDGRDMGPNCCCEMGQLLAVPRPLGGKPRIYQFHILRDTTAGTRFGRLTFTVSADDGRTWTGPKGPGSAYAIDTPSYALAPERNGWHLMAPPLILTNGEVLVPMNVSTDPPALADIRSELVFMVCPNLLSEPDIAKLRFEFYPAPPNGVQVPRREKPGTSLAQEPQVVELSDGRLMCVARTGNGQIAYAVSTDRGRTWSRPEPLRNRPGGDILPHPNAPCPFTRLSGGRYALLFCNNDGTAFGGRSPFDHTRNRQPVYIAVGRELPGRTGQPIAFAKPRPLCSIEGFHPEVGWRDLTYGFLLEDGGEYFHFYNAVWQYIQVNHVDPRLTSDR